MKVITDKTTAIRTLIREKEQEILRIQRQRDLLEAIASDPDLLEAVASRCMVSLTQMEMSQGSIMDIQDRLREVATQNARVVLEGAGQALRLSPLHQAVQEIAGISLDLQQLRRFLDESGDFVSAGRGWWRSTANREPQETRTDGTQVQLDRQG